MSSSEKLYMLRLWREDEGWRASLKPVGKGESAAQYFHSLESLTKFLSNEDFLKLQAKTRVTLEGET